MLGFQFLLILDLLGISFHAVIVFGLGKNLLFNYVLGHCGHAADYMNRVQLNKIIMYMTVTPFLPELCFLSKHHFYIEAKITLNSHFEF